MKDLVDKSMGIVTHITEVLTRIKPNRTFKIRQTMILLQQNNKRRGTRKKCHDRNYDPQ